MTALAGYWAAGAGAESLRRCRSMLSATLEYGSDDSSSARFGDLAIGRNLYRLLPEDGHDRQPLLSAGGRYALVADVRLDNRDELAADLATRIADIADSQLVLQLIERRGIEGIDRLLGDFALACFDLELGRLHLVRDALGQRPLFWHRGRGFVAFASMPKGLHALDEIEWAPDAETVARYLALLPPGEERSFHAGIRRVPPGHVTTVRLSGDGRSRYWAPERRPLRLRAFGDYVDAYRAELDSAVARRLRGARPAAASHLSGGWDSSAVTATAARLVGGDGTLLALTAIPRPGEDAPAPGNRFSDESGLAAATAEMYPCIDHVLVPGGGGSAIAGLDRQAALFERPLLNPCNHGWLGEIRAVARGRGARVLLTGEIGNWTISAAPTTLLADLLRQGRLLRWARESAAMLTQGRARLRGIAASSFGPWLPLPLWRRASRYASAAPIAAQTLLTAAWRSRFEAEQDGFGLGQPRPPKDHFESTVAALTAMDFGEYRKGALGGWGIDERDPTADRRLIEFCLSLPLDMLMKDGVRRPLARAALADRLPASVLDERGKGYQAADWHSGLTRDRARIAGLVERIAADPLAGDMIDVAAMRSLLSDWPDGGWERPETIARYRIALLQALAAGHFLLAASGPAR